MQARIESVSDIPPLVATSVVRGSEQGHSHGGVFIIDPASQAVHQVLDWNTADIDWSGRGWDRGLRGIAFHQNEIYIAASDELFVYDHEFRQQRSFRNRYLKHCHEITVHRGMLYLTSTGFDSILGFDLDQQEFTIGLHAAHIDGKWHAHRFDPRTETGPPARNQLHINSVHADDAGLSFSGLRTRALVSLGAHLKLMPQVELPEGVHNAQIFGDGVIFNDTAVDHLRYVTRDGRERRFEFPRYDDSEIEFAGIDDTKIARQGFGRGLCLVNDRFVAAGSSPSTVTLFDLESGQTVFSVNFSMDIRNAIHGLEVWPWELPASLAQS